jgi:hypothetical protein
MNVLPIDPPAQGTTYDANPFEPDETLNLDHRVQKFLAESGITGNYALTMGCYFADCSVVSMASGIAEERLSSLGSIAIYELVAKLRAAGHELPRTADYEDPFDRRLLYHHPDDDDC